MSTTRVRPADPSDVHQIADLMRDMDRFYGEQVGYTPGMAVRAVREHLFGDAPVARALVGVMGDAVVALAVYSPLWPSVDLKPSLFLKDIFVTARARRRGFARRLLAHLALIAREEGYRRIDWTTDVDNEYSRRLYEAIAVPVNEQKLVYRLEGGALDRLAARVAE